MTLATLSCMDKSQQTLDAGILALAKSVGRAVSAKRKEKGFTQAQIAEKIGVESETISRIERGTNFAPLPRLAKIADALGCSLADLLRDGSHRISDRLQSLDAQFQGLSDSDAKFVFETIDALTARLRERG